MPKKRDKDLSLSEKLSSLIQTKPSAIESDDDDLTTVDKIALNENDSEYSADEFDLPKYRQLNHQLLVEDDSKYSGKGVSRRDLDNSSCNEEDIDSKSEIHSDTQDESAAESPSDNEVEKDTEEAESDLETETQSLDKDSRNKLKVNIHSENSVNEIFLKATSDIEKGRAIRNQLNLWDFLLECRLKFQKCLVASNQFPNYKNLPKFKDIGDARFHNSVLQCKKSLKHLLNSLLIFQDVLLKSNDDFLNSSNSDRKEIEVSDNDDKEICHDSDGEEGFKNENTNTKVKTLTKLRDFSEEINKRHSSFQSYRNNTIQKWNDKTRIGYISNKNFSAFEQSTLKQIEHILLDKQRLIKRTQTKRSNYRILGEEDMEPPTKKPTAQSDNLLATSLDNRGRGLNKEIFDDDDFYHQLLNEMVKRKANDVTDPVQLGRQWMQLQKIRSKMKKTVDTKASKGRKVRFVVHPKLVNFMMPIDNLHYSEEARTELFNSLFGKTKK